MNRLLSEFFGENEDLFFLAPYHQVLGVVTSGYSPRWNFHHHRDTGKLVFN
jgi:hypothetical protein